MDPVARSSLLAGIVLGSIMLCFGSGFAVGRSFENDQLKDVIAGYNAALDDSVAAIRRHDALLEELLRREGHVEFACPMVHQARAAGPPS